MGILKEYDIWVIAIIVGVSGFFSIYNIFYSKYSINAYYQLKEEKEKLNMQINMLKYKNAKLHKYYLYSNAPTSMQD